MVNINIMLLIITMYFLSTSRESMSLGLRRRQLGLGSVIFPEESERPRVGGIPNKVISNLPQKVQEFLDIDQDDLDYFDVDPVDDRFGSRENICKVGRQQSPINVNTQDTVWREYPPLEMNGHWTFKGKVLLFNEGHTIMLKEKGKANRPKISGGPLRETYTFEQLHFHWGPDSSQGSEHTINGQKFAAEAHMVHYQSRYGSYKEAKRNDGILVLGYLFQVSERSNRELDEFVEPISLLSRFKNVTFSSPDILKLFKKASNACYYRYTGSLTTGDCKEGVQWILFNQTIPISSKQLNHFRNMYGRNGQKLRSNYRETQRLNGRNVEFVSKDTSKQPRPGQKREQFTQFNPMRSDRSDDFYLERTTASRYSRY